MYMTLVSIEYDQETQRDVPVKVMPNANTS